MKNSDMPAMPMINDTGGALELARIPDKAGMPTATGLTKREHFAGLAMQGYMASFGRYKTTPSFKETAEEAVEYADALLEELEKCGG